MGRFAVAIIVPQTAFHNQGDHYHASPPSRHPAADDFAGRGGAVAPAAEKETTVRIAVKDKTSIEFYHGQALSGRYHIDSKEAKPFMWPLNAPNGKALTRAWPMGEAVPGEKLDHKHQKSLWFTHGDIIPEGVEIKKKSKNPRVSIFGMRTRITAVSSASRSASRSSRTTMARS